MKRMGSHLALSVLTCMVKRAVEEGCWGSECRRAWLCGCDSIEVLKQRCTVHGFDGPSPEPGVTVPRQSLGTLRGVGVRGERRHHIAIRLSSTAGYLDGSWPGRVSIMYCVCICYMSLTYSHGSVWFVGLYGKGFLLCIRRFVYFCPVAHQNTSMYVLPVMSSRTTYVSSHG